MFSHTFCHSLLTHNPTVLLTHKLMTLRYLFHVFSAQLVSLPNILTLLFLSFDSYLPVSQFPKHSLVLSIGGYQLSRVLQWPADSESVPCNFPSGPLPNSVTSSDTLPKNCWSPQSLYTFSLLSIMYHKLLLLPKLFSSRQLLFHSINVTILFFSVPFSPSSMILAAITSLGSLWLRFCNTITIIVYQEGPTLVFTLYLIDIVKFSIYFHNLMHSLHSIFSP